MNSLEYKTKSPIKLTRVIYAIKMVLNRTTINLQDGLLDGNTIGLDITNFASKGGWEYLSRMEELTFKNGVFSLKGFPVIELGDGILIKRKFNQWLESDEVLKNPTKKADALVKLTEYLNEHGEFPGWVKVNHHEETIYIVTEKFAAMLTKAELQRFGINYVFHN